MIPLNYHHLYYFWTVAKCGSIATAAKQLYLSQPTLSSQLLKLERSCKIKLLERSSKGVVLTPEGQVVFDSCDRIFSEGDELAFRLNNGVASPHVLRMGIDSTVSRDIIIYILDFAREAYPELRVTLLNGEFDVLNDKLRHHALDFVVSGEDCSVRLGCDFRSRLVCTLPVYFVASPAIKKQIKKFPSGLARVPIFLRPPGNPVRKQTDQYLKRHRIFTTVEAEIEDVDLIRHLAVTGRGVATMNVLSAGPDLKSGLLVKLHEAQTGVQEHIWFTCSVHPKPNPFLRAIIEALMKNFKV